MKTHLNLTALTYGSQEGSCIESDFISIEDKYLLTKVLAVVQWSVFLLCERNGWEKVWTSFVRESMFPRLITCQGINITFPATFNILFKKKHAYEHCSAMRGEQMGLEKDEGRRV